MPDNAIKKILKDMEKQGFPLEVRVTEILKANGWDVENQQAYIDTETGKQRTIDIEGIKNLDVPMRDPWEKHRWVFQVRLILECKKSNKPWVFYASEIGRDEIERNLEINAQIHVDELGQLIYPRDPQDILDSKDTDYILGFQQELARLAVFENSASIAYEPFKEGEGHSIQKARMQVCKALTYLKHELEQDTTEMLNCILFKPVIIFDGPLYIYQDQNLSESKGLYYSVSHYDSRFFIEIVKVDFLQKYLEAIKKSIGNFEKSFKIRDKRKT